MSENNPVSHIKEQFNLFGETVVSRGKEVKGPYFLFTGGELIEAAQITDGVVKVEVTRMGELGLSNMRTIELLNPQVSSYSTVDVKGKGIEFTDHNKEITIWERSNGSNNI